MKKRRIRYSELAPAPKERRDSTPVELARALAAARETAPGAGPSPVAQGDNDAVVLSEAKDLHPNAVVLSEAKDLHNAVVLSEAKDLHPNRAELLIVAVGRERFAIPLSEVEEAVDLPVIHFVPEMPATMLGVISLRGGLVPVYSPHLALGQPLASRTAVLIFRTAARRVGVVVDDVEDAVIVEEDDLRELPATTAEDLVVGVLHHEGQLISVMRGGSLVAACREARMQSTP